MQENSSRFARFVSIRVRPGKETDFAKTFEEKILPTALKEAGLRRVYLLRALGSPSEFVTFSLWDSEKEAEEYTDSGRYRSYVSKLSELLEEEPTVSRFAVGIHALGQSVKPLRKKGR
jgi:quinol monooxygenase YgiN